VINVHVDIDYRTHALIGKHTCSKCGGNFKLSEGLMVGIAEGTHKATIFICEKCLRKPVSYQTPEFDINKERYPKLDLR